MRTYQVTIEGKTPLIMHQDNIPWSDQMKKWETDPRNKATSTKGDDRTPPFRWLGSLYHDGTHAAIPSDNIMAALMGGGKLLATGKGQKTFKAQTQSGIMAPEVFWPVLVDGHPVPTAELFQDFEMRSMEEWYDLTTRLGFMLLVKRAPIGKAKHVRVRPKFDRWSASGTMVVLDEAIKPDILTQIGELAGQYAGLGDWRPSSPQKPGSFGMFEFKVKKG
jgi:hypothetical protein